MALRGFDLKTANKKGQRALTFASLFLDDSARDKDCQAKSNGSPNARKEDLLEFRALVWDIDGRDEEWNISGDEDRDCAPPWIYPDESRGSGKEDLEDRIEERHRQHGRELAWDAFEIASREITD